MQDKSLMFYMIRSELEDAVGVETYPPRKLNVRYIPWTISGSAGNGRMPVSRVPCLISSFAPAPPRKYPRS